MFMNRLSIRGDATTPLGILPNTHTRGTIHHTKRLHHYWKTPTRTLRRKRHSPLTRLQVKDAQPHPWFKGTAPKRSRSHIGAKSCTSGLRLHDRGGAIKHSLDKQGKHIGRTILQQDTGWCILEGKFFFKILL